MADWNEIGGAVLSGGAIQWLAGGLWKKLRSDPKGEAEARRINIQADDLIVQRLYAEIERLERKVDELDAKLETERSECDVKIAAMQGRIRQLEQQQTSLGNFGNNVAEGPLHAIFQPDHEDKDGDLVRKLNRVPGTRKRASKPRRGD